MRWEELRYRPHLAQYDGQEIVVVVRDRELSNAQESGLEYAWFEREVRARTKWCRVPPLVTTCTDGENGGWFRNVNHRANFWGAFYGELCDRARAPGAASRPTFIDDYLNMHGAQGYVTVRTGAWNTGWHHERDFMQWTGSQAQQDTLRRTWALSGVIQEVRRRANDAHHHLPAFRHELESALWHVRRAETSCYVYWGEAWVTRAHADLDRADWPRGRARACVP
jgi:alpha-amylase/alpha-mannosidase (GH57 family)